MTCGVFLLFFSVCQNELAFPDTPRGMAWVGDNIFLCMKKDLYLTTVRKNAVDSW